MSGECCHLLSTAVLVLSLLTASSQGVNQSSKCCVCAVNLGRDSMASLIVMTYTRSVIVLAIIYVQSVYHAEFSCFRAI